MNPSLKIASGFVALIATIFIVASSSKIWENVDAGENVICQDLLDGEMHAYISPGIQWQNLGKCTHYFKSEQLWFTTDTAVTGNADTSEPFRIRFNDGGSATIHGSIRYDSSSSTEHLIRMHSTFGSQESVERDLIRTVVAKAVYATGPLMSSKESYSDRRNELIDDILDQSIWGVYKTTSKEITTKDQLSGDEKTVTIVEITKQDGKPLRAETSVVQNFGVGLSNLSITKVEYDTVVEQQINQQQQATMQVQTAMANAKKAEQDKITTEEQGKANAAEAKWIQETLNAKEVAFAEKEVQVAKLAAEAAELTKKQQILLGQGEAERKRLVLNADGALEKKLAAWIEIQKAYATAIAAYQGQWVPTVVMGEDKSRNGSNGASNLVDFLTIKTAKDLALDLSVPQGASSKK